MHTESRQFLVFFDNGSRKVLTGTTVEGIILKALSYLVGLRKDFSIKAVVDEANAKIYGDIDWDCSYTEKDNKWLIGSTKTYTSSDIENAVITFAKTHGFYADAVEKWLKKQNF